jgi:hypothetical protein
LAGAGSIGNWLAAAVSVKLQFELLAGSNPRLQIAQGSCWPLEKGNWTAGLIGESLYLAAKDEVRI